MCVENYKLKPCPRCGGKGELGFVCHSDDVDNVLVYHTLPVACAVECTKCGARGKHTIQMQVSSIGFFVGDVDLETEMLHTKLNEKAVAYWNSGLMSDD